MVEPLFFGGGASRPFDIPTKKEMVTQFRKEMSESKSQGMHEEVRLYDDVGSYRGTSLELLISNR